MKQERIPASPHSRKPTLSHPLWRGKFKVMFEFQWHSRLRRCSQDKTSRERTGYQQMWCAGTNTLGCCLQLFQSGELIMLSRFLGLLACPDCCLFSYSFLLHFCICISCHSGQILMKRKKTQGKPTTTWPHHSMLRELPPWFIPDSDKDSTQLVSRLLSARPGSVVLTRYLRLIYCLSFPVCHGKQ